MNPKVDMLFGYLKKLLIWLVAPLGFIVFIFFLGEQYEVGRLSAVREVLIRSRVFGVKVI
jgi:hypothetical protein